MSLKNPVSAIRSNAVFTEFSDEELGSLVTYCKTKSFAENETIIREGSTGTEFFIIISGEVGISKDVSSQVVFFITSLHRGDFFGEMALIAGYPRSANASARSAVTALAVDSQSFKRMQTEAPDLFGKLSWVFSQTLAERLFKMEERISRILNASLTDNLP